MFISDMCHYNLKVENKCNRIFRPWAITNEVDNFQDSTVSTTTAEVQETQEVCDMKVTESRTVTHKEGFRALNKISPTYEETRVASVLHTKSLDPGSLPDPYMSEYHDLLKSNFVQSLGVTSADPLLLETMTHGFALEEYARVLNQEHQAKLLAAKKQRPKKYKCPHCQVGFSNNGQLKGHIRIHTGERPFKCEEKECGKTFTRNEELTRHKRIHSGLRPFPCIHCGKRFGRKDHLKKHSRTHFQPRGLYAVPIMLPYDTWATSSGAYPFIPMVGY